MRKVKRIKNVLCVLLATIISLVSMTTVKADGEVAPYEDMENATLLQKECYDLDEDTMIEITTYEKSIHLQDLHGKLKLEQEHIEL